MKTPVANEVENAVMARLHHLSNASQSNVLMAAIVLDYWSFD
jgi:hypothetical protein